MKLTKTASAVFLFFALCISGCAHVPVVDKPIEIKRSYQSSFDAVWNVVFEVIKKSEGDIVTEDKSSGLLVYRVSDEASPYGKVYMQVYAKQLSPSGEVSVYLFPRDRSGYSFGEIQRNFFEEVDEALSGSQK